MFATEQLRAHRSESAHKYGISEGKEEVDPDAQLRRRVIGNERMSEDAGGESWLGDAFRGKELLVLIPHTLDRCPC